MAVEPGPAVSLTDTAKVCLPVLADVVNVPVEHTSKGGPSTPHCVAVGSALGSLATKVKVGRVSRLSEAGPPVIVTVEGAYGIVLRPDAPPSPLALTAETA